MSREAVQRANDARAKARESERAKAETAALRRLVETATEAGRALPANHGKRRKP